MIKEILKRLSKIAHHLLKTFDPKSTRTPHRYNEDSSVHDFILRFSRYWKVSDVDFIVDEAFEERSDIQKFLHLGYLKNYRLVKKENRGNVKFYEYKGFFQKGIHRFYVTLEKEKRKIISMTLL